MRRTLITTGLLAATCFLFQSGTTLAQDTDAGKKDEGTLELTPLGPTESKATQPDQTNKDQPETKDDGPMITPMNKVAKPSKNDPMITPKQESKATARPELPGVLNVNDEGDNWEIQIISRQAMNGEPVRAVVQPPVVVTDPKGGPIITPGPISPSQYEQIYGSIPFRRSEYRANPSYRHDATMEIMFGQLRPTVIHRHNFNPSSQVMGTTVREYRRITVPAIPRFQRFGGYRYW